MGGVPTKHHTRSKVGRRRSHLALKKSALAVCLHCQGPVVPHRACPQCGLYSRKEKTSPAVKETPAAPARKI